MPPYAYPVDGTTLRVVVRAAAGTLRSVTALYNDRYAPAEEGEHVALELAGSDGTYDYFQGRLSLRPPRFQYAFLLDDGLRRVWFSEAGFSDAPPKGKFFTYPYINEADLYDVPDWLIDGVVYEVFPERFANGENDPAGVRPWSDDRPTYRSFYGGDLEGIIERLPHLEELGVTVLYLTPVFASPSNHKYDTTDYYRIDPHFGDEDTLKELVRRCHARGIRVMLDGVFNHCGYDFFAFRDVRERGRESPYAGWFHVDEFPVKAQPESNYETFATGIASMPKLRTGNPAVRDYLLGVARYWIEACDIDGWRLDVANEVDHVFWREFRRVVRAAKPSAAIVGEVWHDALPWLLGDQFDGVTNYPVREACLEFFARGRLDARGFSQALTRNLFAYPRQALQASWNLLGSHDTERFLTACGGDVRKTALAAVFLMTWVGVPLIYYGDEVGMEGGGDPDCRRPMNWDWRGGRGEALCALYKRLIRLRRETPALRRGEARIVHADPVGNTVAYWRGFGRHAPGKTSGYQPHGRDEDGVIIVLNNSPRERAVPLAALGGAAPKPVVVTVLLDGGRMTGAAESAPAAAAVIEGEEVRIPPYGATLVHPAS